MNSYPLDAFTNVWENKWRTPVAVLIFAGRLLNVSQERGSYQCSGAKWMTIRTIFFPFIKNWNQGWVKTCNSWAFSRPLSAVVFFCIGYTKQDWVIRLIDGENAQVWRTETEAWSRTNFRLCAQLILSSFFFFLKIPLFWRRTR